MSRAGSRELRRRGCCKGYSARRREPNLPVLGRRNLLGGGRANRDYGKTPRYEESTALSFTLSVDGRSAGCGQHIQSKLPVFKIMADDLRQLLGGMRAATERHVAGFRQRSLNF